MSEDERNKLPDNLERALPLISRTKSPSEAAPAAEEVVDEVVEEVVDAVLEPAPSGKTGLVRYDPTQRYLQEVRKHKPLSAEAERELALRFKEDGNLDAAYALVTSQLRLVVRIAFEFKRSWQNLLDLIQEGNVGLLLAVRKFDPYRGLRLSTYASWWIRAYIIKFVLDNWRMVKVGTTNARRKLLFNLRKEKDALIARGIHPEPKLLADRLGVSEEDVIDVDRSLGIPDASLESPIGGEDSSFVLGDTLASSDIPVDIQVEENQRRDIINSKLEAFAVGLPERERVVFRERLLAEEPATLQQLGDRFGLTREGLRQVEKRLLRSLKAYLVQELEGMTGIDVSDTVEEPKSKRAKKARKASPKRLKAANTDT